MANTDGDDDLELHQASANLLTDLKHNVIALLQRPSGQVHRYIKQDDLNRTVQLIEPFQADPQLLDTQLKTIVPPIVDAYLASLLNKHGPGVPRGECVLIEHAVCVLLYTLSKVRGYRIIMGFLNNEPKYLEPILERLEAISNETDSGTVQWQTTYILLLWLSHLLLAPFALDTISAKPFTPSSGDDHINVLLSGLQPLTSRCVQVALRSLSASTKAQDAASVLITRVLIRPDVQSERLEDGLLQHQLTILRTDIVSTNVTQYQQIGSLKLLARIVASVELERQVPRVFEHCQLIFDESGDLPAASNAVGKKLSVKIFRSVALTALKSASLGGPLLSFVEQSGVLEYVIDYLLRSLADKDTPVRLAAAKAISTIVLELEPAMGHEVIQAVLDSFKEDIPRTNGTANFATVDPLKWHGLTLTLAHVLFRRSASPEQLPDIVNALFFTLQFQQRTATGTLLGTNVRDAANFGIWSLARRYTTPELLSVNTDELSLQGQRDKSGFTIIQILATELLLSACLDPAGNIRRGSSAALQELIGRHPNEVFHGIALVQIVDYQAVGLRNRAMIDIAGEAACLHVSYWHALLLGLLDWRGLGSADVDSREGAATSIAAFWTAQPASEDFNVVTLISRQLHRALRVEAELFHGNVLAVARIVQEGSRLGKLDRLDSVEIWNLLPLLDSACADFSPRVLRSELPASATHFLTRLSALGVRAEAPLIDILDRIVARLLTRHEELMYPLLAVLAKAQYQYKSSLGLTLGPIDLESLCNKVQADALRSGLHGAGRAIALGALLPDYLSLSDRISGSAAAVECLCDLLSATAVDWRIVGAKAIKLFITGLAEFGITNRAYLQQVCLAVERGLNDYTIDERGDIGSLVRLQSILCASTMFTSEVFTAHEDLTNRLYDNICRLSLEKLDRTRLLAAQCRKAHLTLAVDVSDVAHVSSIEYFAAALGPLVLVDTASSTRTALLLGCISCAGSGAEPVLVASRQVLARSLAASSTPIIEGIFTELNVIIQTLLGGNVNSIHSALELLAFLLEVGATDRLATSASYKWRSLFLTVQKAHYKSGDIPRLLAAVRVYSGLSRISPIRAEVLNKLVSMLKTNPYPRVRFAIVETLWMTTSDFDLLTFDTTIPSSKQKERVQTLEQRCGNAKATVSV